MRSQKELTLIEKSRINNSQMDIDLAIKMVTIEYIFFKCAHFGYLNLLNLLTVVTHLCNMIILMGFFLFLHKKIRLIKIHRFKKYLKKNTGLTITGDCPSFLPS